ncbi:hypothetical protein GCM10010423_72570 [Streptomyces levis]|uniref:Uncharacterized protein n=1 Tax=Streptomyces levis TaxID=285566 RepID=A0ABN3P4T1_9ACTN
MARRDFSLRRVESGADLPGAGWADLWADMGRIYQVDKTERLAESEGVIARRTVSFHLWCEE